MIEYYNFDNINSDEDKDEILHLQNIELRKISVAFLEVSRELDVIKERLTAGGL